VLAGSEGELVLFPIVLVYHFKIVVYGFLAVYEDDYIDVGDCEALVADIECEIAVRVLREHGGFLFWNT